MRIHVQDFSGHPFQVQLSRSLAARGHEVRHTYSGEYVTGHGRLSVEPGDPDTFSVGAIETGVPFDKYHVKARLRFELAYGKAWIRELERHRPDVVLVCNVPLLAMARANRWLRASTPTVFWHQDVYSLAMSDHLAAALPAPVGGMAARKVQAVERDILRSSSAVIAIADTFREQYRTWNLDLPDVSVIPNWAPISDITPRERDNAWSSHWPAGDALRMLYAGTLGRKHNPDLLLELLRAVRERGVDASLCVVSEGPGADDVAAAGAGDPQVRVLPFQPADVLPDVLASADVLVALLEPEASRFSVPSKVASYLAAGRPVGLLGPTDNPVSDDLRNAGGMVAAPDQRGASVLADWVAKLAGDAEHRAATGESARAFAERRYDIDSFVERFEAVLDRAAAQPPGGAAGGTSLLRRLGRR